MLKPSNLTTVLVFSGLIFVMDALVLNAAFVSFLVMLFQVVAQFPLMVFQKEVRRQRLRNICIFGSVLTLAFVMMNVNAYVARSRAERLIKAIESYRAESGVYPKTLEDLVPKFIDYVPWAQFTLMGKFYYVRFGPTDPPIFWYNPHGMDHRGYHFDTKDWSYVG